MATSLVHDAKHGDWTESPPSSERQMQWLMWTLLSFASIALLGAFLFFVIDDYTLRT
jgi:hypothetical protein